MVLEKSVVNPIQIRLSNRFLLLLTIVSTDVFSEWLIFCDLNKGPFEMSCLRCQNWNGCHASDFRSWSDWRMTAGNIQYLRCCGDFMLLRMTTLLCGMGVARNLFGGLVFGGFPLILGVFLCIFRLSSQGPIHLGDLNLKPPKYAHALRWWNLKLVKEEWQSIKLIVTLLRWCTIYYFADLYRQICTYDATVWVVGYCADDIVCRFNDLHWLSVALGLEGCTFDTEAANPIVIHILLLS